jgi:hypothetical protein
VDTLVTAREADGRIVQSTNTVIVLATGQHYLDTEGQWRESRPEIAAVAEGFVAAQGPTRVRWPAALSLEAEVVIETTDGGRFRAGVLGLSYYDTASGRNVMIAEVRETPGALAGANRLVYADAFDGVRADVVYEVRLAGLAQEVILREQPPGPEMFGLDPATTRLEAVTEFLEAPTPRREARPLRTERDAARRAALADPDFVDERLVFGEWALEAGRAFADGARAAEDEASSPEAGVPVAKRWEVVDGRTILFEQVEWPAVARLLEALPRQANALTVPETLPRRAAVERQLPARDRLYAQGPRPSQLSPRSHGRESAPAADLLAGAPASSVAPGVVLDYELLQSQTNFTFRADTTYHVTGTVNLSGTTTLEGGTVVKFAPQNSTVRINYSGPLVCQTGPYRPAIFTARDDNTVGEVVPGSTGTPSGWYGWFGLYANGAGQSVKLEHLRFNYLHCPVGFSGGTAHAVRHTRIVNAKFGLYAISQTTPVTVANALFHNLGTGGQVFYGGSTPTVVAEHVTIRNAVSLHNGVNLTLRNSLLAGVTTVQTYTGDHTTQLASDAGVFASVGAGANYLAVGSPYRAAGTEAIAATLLGELRAWGTTREPAVWTAAITADTVWEPLVERSAGLPDLGYHYPALDYAVSGVSLNNATLTLTNGVAVAVYGASGLTITEAGKLRGQGAPSLLNRLVRHSAVQEQWLPAWAGGTSGTLLKNDAAGQSSSEVRLRFTECVVPAAGGHFFNGGVRLGRLALTDCELHGGSLNFNAAGTYARVVALTNNVLNRVPFSLGTGADTTLTTYARNNLFRGITTGNLNAASGNAWEWRDNLFDTASLWQYFGGVANSHNAYRNCPRQLTPAGSGNVTVTALSYTADAWGRGWYASTTPSLLNAGSWTAGAAGLYHYTTQTSQAKEQSTQVDIGFHYVAYDPTTGAPADADYDGLACYREDANGNGIVDYGESDPANPVSNPSGTCLDGEYYGQAPSLTLSYYRLDATRDLTNTDPLSPRLSYYPDATANVWFDAQRRAEIGYVGNYGECLADPENPSIETKSDLLTWPPGQEGHRYRTNWLQGGGLVSFDEPLNYGRPPSLPELAWERCMLTGGGAWTMSLTGPTFTGTFTRQADTKQLLFTGGPEWPKPKRSILFQVAAINKSGGLSVQAGGAGYGLGEPDARWQGTDLDPLTTQMLFRHGARVDPQGQVMLQEPKGQRLTVALGITGVPWYQYRITVGMPHTVRMTWSRHPTLTTVPDVQAKFDEGARLLATDDDPRIADADPVVTPGSPQFDAHTYNQDDVPVYMEFIVIKARQSAFPPPFNNAKYQNITDPRDLAYLCVARFANIKVVQSIAGGEGGFVHPDGDRSGMVLVAGGLTGALAAHESGHLASLEHRGYQPPGNPPPPPPNPGDPNDAKALMFSPLTDPGPDSPGNMNEVNRLERAAFYNWHPAFYNQ